MKTCYTILLFLSLFFISQAQNPVQKDSITELDEVILLEALKSSAENGIVPTQIIGGKVFKNYSPIDIVSAINQVSGVYILSGALNTNRITVRGIGARTLYGTDKLRLYYNNIPITNGSGFSTIESFDLENLSHIDLIKGPKGTNFGANLGGAILLNSKQPATGSSYFRNSLTVGSYNLLKNNFLFTLQEDKLSLSLHYGHTETDGYRENNRFEQDGILLDINYRLSPKTDIGLLVNNVDYTAQIPSSLGLTDFLEDPKQAAFTWKSAKGYEANNYSLAGLTLNHAFSGKLKNSTSIFYNYLDHYEPRPFGILDEFTHGFGFRTKFTGEFDLGTTNVDYSFGGELYKDEYNWSEYENDYRNNGGQGSKIGEQFAENKEFRRQFNVFGNLLFPLSNDFSAQIGMSINKTYYDFRDQFNDGNANMSAERNFKPIFLPSLNLNYAISGENSVYLNISRGFSNPSLEETLTPDGVINPDISQETGINYEIGTQWRLLKQKMRVDLALYRMDVKNLLVAQRVGDDQYVGKNAGKTKHQGVELEMEYQWDLSPKLSLSPFLSYTYSHHKFVSFIDDGNDYSGNPLTGVPAHRLNSGLQATFAQQFYWNTTHNYIGEIPLTDANTLYSDPFTIINSKIGYRNQLAKNLYMDFSFGLNNVFDTKYARSVLINTTGFGGSEPRYYYPGDGKNYYGSLQLRYAL
ncbi:Vitamin B12 transporter BtuB [Arenibacter antarcticus]|uniref:TonB-dependent receptor family protein n=1 Tax=Arenibacter antarcticus TaxID=2040469 RepID=A0ABW5VGY6_9FLAO|nr:TonB-dependent receptor [Arenibacter sp. H213]MCM4166735.1 TonB-dependent receptor [Arenibacter sp. H213]